MTNKIALLMHAYSYSTTRNGMQSYASLPLHRAISTLQHFRHSKITTVQVYRYRILAQHNSLGELEQLRWDKNVAGFSSVLLLSHG